MNEKIISHPLSGTGEEEIQKGRAEYHVGFVCTVIEVMIRDHLRRLHFTPDDFNLHGILNSTEIRNGIIRGRYRKYREQLDRRTDGQKETIKETMEMLGKQFKLCEDTVKKIVEGRR